MIQILQQKRFHDPDVVAKKVFPQSLLMKMNSLMTFLDANNRSPMMVRTVLSEDYNKYSEPAQWHWEVRSWFNMAILTTRASLFTSSRGEKLAAGKPGDYFPNTRWICNKVLYLNVNSIYMNVDFIGLICTFTVLGFSIFLSYADILFTAVKDSMKRCQVVWLAIETMSRRLRRKIRGWGFVFEWFRKQYGSEWLPRVNQSVSGESNRLSQCLNSGIQLILRSPLAFSLFRRQSNIHDGDYIDDGEIPSASINLAQLNT
jgi:hypothetical protein